MQVKENKEVLTKTLNNIDNQLGEVSTKTEKANLLDKELKAELEKLKSYQKLAELRKQLGKLKSV